MEKIKKISFITLNPFPQYSGGIETWLYNITTNLTKRGYQILIFSPKSHQDVQPFFDISQWKKVKLYRLPAINKFNTLFKKHINFSLRIILITLDYFIWTFISSLKIILLRKKLAFSKLIILGTIPSIFPVLIAKPFLKNTLLIASVRGIIADDLTQKTGSRLVAKVYEKIEKICLKKCSLVLANGYDTQRYLQKIGVISQVLPNGVNFQKFSTPLQQLSENNWIKKIKEYRNKNIQIIMMVATLRDLKGVPDLIQAVPLIKKLSPLPFKIIFVGKGNPDTYQKIINRFDLQIQKQIEFAGEQKQIQNFLHLADIVVGLAVGGGIAHAPLEYMAARKPIVAWNSNVYKQLLKHQHSALLAKNKDINDLATQIINLLNNKNLANQLAKNAQAEAREYDWAKITDRLIKILPKNINE